MAGDLVVFHCFFEHLSPLVSLFTKKVAFSCAFFLMYYDYFCKMFVGIHSFNSSVYFSGYKICSHLHLLTHFFSMHFRTPVTVKQTSYQSSYIFRAGSVILKWEQWIEAATSPQKIFYRAPSRVEKLLLSNSYFLITNTFSDQLLQYKYFFSTGTVIFGRTYFPRISL